MVTVLAGSNWFALKSELDKALNDFEAKFGELTIERINAADSTSDEILAAVGGISLFSEDKMVVLYYLSANKEASDKLEKILESTSESTRLVIVEKSLDKRSVYYKALKKLKNFREYSELSEDGLISWADAYVKEVGGNISRADVQYLVDRIGANQTLLEREITKLVTYKKEVSRETIDELTEANPSSTVFNLVESAFNGNVKGALKLYDEQRALRKEPQAIYGMLVWQMHLVAICAASGDKSPAEMSNETGINSYSLSKAQNIARKMGAGKVQEFLKLLRDIEITSKKQTFDFDEALKFAITKLAY